MIERYSLSGLIKLELDCGGEKTLFFVSPISLKADELKEIMVPDYTLSKAGNCVINSILESRGAIKDSAQSKRFTVSSAINLSISLNKERFSPGETIILEGDAKKVNDQPVSGISYITIDGETYLKSVENGKFKFTTLLKKTILSGQNLIKVEIQDKEGNTGEAYKNITINAIPTSLEIKMNKESFIPGDNLEARAVLYDQSGREIAATPISIILYDTWGMEVVKKMTNSSEGIDYKFDKKSQIGEWWVYAYSEGIKARKFFSVKEFSSIDAKIKESILEIENVGNTLFRKPVEIIFSGQEKDSKIKEIDLGIDDKKEFELTAPTGFYNITIRSGDIIKQFPDVYLTGNSISIIDTKDIAAQKTRGIAALATVGIIAAAALTWQIIRIRGLHNKKKKEIKI